MRLIPCSRIVRLLRLKNELTLLTLINLGPPTLFLCLPLLLSPSHTQQKFRLTEQTEIYLDFSLHYHVAHWFFFLCIANASFLQNNIASSEQLYNFYITF